MLITTLHPCMIFTGRNEVVAKVMFLQVCVCPQRGRVSASVHAGMPDPHPDQGDPPGTRQTLPQTRQTPPGRPPRTRQTPRDQADNPPRPGRHPPRPGRHPSPGPGRPPSPGSRLQHTVYERPVRILLECILVTITLVKKFLGNQYWRILITGFLFQDTLTVTAVTGYDTCRRHTYALCYQIMVRYRVLLFP